MRFARGQKRILVMAAMLFGVACSRPPAPVETKSTAEIKRYELRGEVKRLEPDNIAVIQHEKIGDWMGAMTMQFPVKDAAEFAKLRPQERIKATVFVQDLQFWVGEIQEDAK